MKKLLLAVSLIFAILLAGCGKNESVNNNVSEVIDNQQQEVVNNGNETKVIGDIEKYKLSENYKLNGLEYYSYFNVGVTSDVTSSLEYIEDFDWSNAGTLDYRNLIDNVNSYDFESNDRKYNIKCTLNENGTLDVKLNDKKVTFVTEKKNDVWSGNSIYAIGVIDLDSTDNLKEIVLRESAGDIFIKNVIYRLNDNDKLEEFYPENISYDKILCINDRFIFPAFLFGGPYDVSKSEPIIGYYTYDNGKLVYVDRLLNGEKAIDDSGKLNIDATLEFGAEFG